jgi:hypothetical protein
MKHWIFFASLLVIAVRTTMAAPVPAHGVLGTSAALDPSGALWIAYAEVAGEQAHVVLRRSPDDGRHWDRTVRVTAKPEPVSADGENRPKLAFGRHGEMFVSWTSPTSAHYTGDIHFSRSLDGGKSWSAPAVVHHDRQLITHRFESLIVDGEGRVWAVWVDKRDVAAAEAAQRSYAGAAIYYSYSEDRGATWHGDFRLAEHTCECCRIAVSTDEKGRAAVMWRHVFPPNERDHAYAVLEPGHDPVVERVTFDHWRVDACPHQGPGLTIAPNGTRHAVWFTQVEDRGRVFYGQPGAKAPRALRSLPEGASHADVAVAGDTVAIAWKRFDGQVTRVESWISRDGGQRFVAGPTLESAADSDQPRLVSAAGKMLLVWRRSNDVAVERLTGAPGQTLSQLGAAAAPPQQAAQVRPFGRDSLREIEQRYAGQPFWLILWDLECTYCMKSLTHVAQAQRAHPDLRVVTVATDSVVAAAELQARLAQLGVQSEPYAYADVPAEALRYAIDPTWMGEKPRAYRYEANGKRTAVTGVIAADRLAKL